MPYSLKIDRRTLRRCGFCLNYGSEIRRISRFLARPHLSSRECSLDLLARHRIVHGTCHGSQSMSDTHLLDEGPTSPAHGQMKLDVQPRPEADIAIDQEAGTLGDFTASKNGSALPGHGETKSHGDVLRLRIWRTSVGISATSANAKKASVMSRVTRSEICASRPLACAATNTLSTPWPR